MQCSDGKLWVVEDMQIWDRLCTNHQDFGKLSLLPFSEAPPIKPAGHIYTMTKCQSKELEDIIGFLSVQLFRLRGEPFLHWNPWWLGSGLGAGFFSRNVWGWGKVWRKHVEVFKFIKKSKVLAVEELDVLLLWTLPRPYWSHIKHFSDRYDLFSTGGFCK